MQGLCFANRPEPQHRKLSDWRADGGTGQLPAHKGYIQEMPRQNSTFETVARIGYATRGAVFLLVGSLSMMAAIGATAAAPAPKDIFSNLLGQPFGRLALILI